MIILRGESTAVIDLTALLGLIRTPSASAEYPRARMIAVRHGGTTVCLLVDQVEGLCDVAQDDLVPPPPIIAGANADWLDYVTHRPTGELVGVINVEGALSRASLTSVEGSATCV
jgi:chemotaxis signal transduction protein